MIIFAAFESPAIIAGLNDVAVMDQPVEQRSGSVFERWRADASYRPPNLDAWAEEKGVDPAGLQAAVRATDPEVAVACAYAVLPLTRAE